MSCARSRRTRIPRPRGEVLLRSLGLELRQLMSASPLNPEADLPLPGDPGTPCGCALCAGQMLEWANAGIESIPGLPLTGGNSDPNAYTARPSSQVPAYSSLPGSAYTLHLDFNGHTTGTWGSWTNVTTPVYDTDGDTATFSSSELIAIEDIFRRVAEDFAPFNINVTTVDPGNLTNGRTLKVAIGGTYGDWFGQSAGGVGYVGGFYNSAPNVVFVFAKNLGGGLARYVAEAASHEAGHGFGLSHQSSYSGTTKTAEYSQGTGPWAPIMGVGYYASQTTWHNGPNSNGSTALQDDMAILANASNGFGYRADDHAQTLAAATTLTFVGNTTQAEGIIAQNSDRDWFQFSTSGGSVSFTVATSYVGANLDAVLELQDSTGQVVASANPSNSSGASLTTNLAAGTYVVVVRSTGVYGSVGQYELTGTAPQGPVQTSPEIVVQQGTSSLASGGTVNFGSTTVGTAVTRVFTVRNTGTAALDLTSLAGTLPAGFSLAADLGSTTLAPGASTTFTLRYDAAAVGTQSGAVVLANSDADEGSFTINVTGTATAGMVTRILDNGDAGFTTVGQWSTSTKGYTGDAHLSNRTTTGNTATWSFETLPPGRYQVYGTWTASSTASTVAKFAMFNGSQLARSVVANQRANPTGTVVSGAKWVSLGTVDVTAGTLNVRLSVAGKYTLVADAIRIKQISALAGAGTVAGGAVVGGEARGAAEFLWSTGANGGASRGAEHAPAASPANDHADSQPAVEDVTMTDAGEAEQAWSAEDFLPGKSSWLPLADSGDGGWRHTTDGFFATGGSDFQEINDRLDALDAAVASLLSDDV